MARKGFEPIGVQAIALGVEKFLGDLSRMEAKWDATQKRFRESGKFAAVSGARVMGMFQDAMAGAVQETQKGGDQMSAFSGVMGLMIPKLTGAAGGVGTLASAIGGPIGLIAGLGAAIGAIFLFKKALDGVKQIVLDVTGAIAQQAKEGFLLAGRFQELELAALTVGRAVGLQRDEIEGTIDAVHDLNIRYDVAAKAVAQMARYNIDLSKATELVSVAQGAAVIAGLDSSETLERLVWATTTHNTYMLRRMGIMVDLTAAEDRYAEGLDKTREQLSATERVQADLNAVLAAGAPLLDVYAEAMKSPTKIMRSLSYRVIPEIRAGLMQAFVPAAGTAVGAVYRLADAFREALMEGGALYPALVRLGAIAGVLADGFAAAIEVIIQFITDTETTFVDGLVGIAEDALFWGAEIVAWLAEGIIRGASTVLVTAMNFVSDVLLSWLGPGSPPKIAPLLPEWGMAAMAEYLKGFTQADFSALDKLKGPLEKALGKKGAAGFMLEFARGLTLGTLEPDFYEQLARSSAMFGDEVAELARREFELANALSQVEMAQRKVSQEQSEIARLTAEYNEMLIGRAPKEALEAKLAEINAAEERLAVASQEKTEAEANIDAMKEQATLQEKLVKQLFDLTEAIKEQAGGSGRAAKAAGSLADALSRIKPPDPETWELGARLSAAIEEAKTVIKERLEDIFAPLIDQLEELAKEGGPIARVRDAFGRLSLKMSNLKSFSDNRFVPMLRALANVYLAALELAVNWVTGAYQRMVDDGMLPSLAVAVGIFMPGLLPVIKFLREDLGGAIAWVTLKLQQLADLLSRLAAVAAIWFGIEGIDIPSLDITGPGAIGAGAGIAYGAGGIGTFIGVQPVNVPVSQPTGGGGAGGLPHGLMPRNVQIQVGPNNITGPMSRTRFEQRVTRSLRRGLG